MKASAVLAGMRALPIADLDVITSGAATLVLAPHPDDESLGCGGLIAECCSRGQPPVIVILTDGVGSHPASKAFPPARLRTVRAREAQDATRILGVPDTHLHFLNVADTVAPHAGPEFDALVTVLAGLLRRHDCHTILAPWRHDPHGDHVAASAMAAAAAHDAGARHWAYPVWGWTLPGDADLPGNAPSGVRIDISRHLNLKRRAIQAHLSQHAGLITDDPQGFQMPPEFIALFETPTETYLDP